MFHSKNCEKAVKEQCEIYISTLCHDLKTPLLAQIRILNLLKAEVFGNLTSEQHDMLDLLLNSCNYIQDLVYNILSVYKYNSGGIVLNYSEFDFNSLVKECMKEIVSLAQEKNLDLRFAKINAPSVIISADKLEIKRVLINLMTNAIEHTVNYGFIKLDYTVIDDNLNFSIFNSGLAIPEEIIGFIFASSPLKISKYRKIGSGLGLYITKKIIQSHCGNLFYQKRKDGNVIGFTIPAYKTIPSDSVIILD